LVRTEHLARRSRTPTFVVIPERPATTRVVARCLAFEHTVRVGQTSARFWSGSALVLGGRRHPAIGATSGAASEASALRVGPYRSRVHPDSFGPGVARRVPSFRVARRRIFKNRWGCRRTGCFFSRRAFPLAPAHKKEPNASNLDAQAFLSPTMIFFSSHVSPGEIVRFVQTLRIPREVSTVEPSRTRNGFRGQIGVTLRERGPAQPGASWRDCGAPGSRLNPG